MMQRKTWVVACTLWLALCSSLANALTFDLPEEGNTIVGEVQHITTEPGDNFYTLARKYDVGYYELVEANPDLDPESPKPWQELIIPTQYILPAVKWEGIIINQAELRLYYFPPGQKIVVTYPVGIGREGWKTPVGKAKVIAKTKDPVWTVPPSIRKDAEERGSPLPEKVMPGPENPLGKFAMRLSLPSYLIHGTNNPNAIGMRSTAGCLRLFPEDIEQLFAQTRVNTPVQIIEEPYKVGWLQDNLYLEAHLPLQEQREQQVEQAENLTPITKIITQALKKRLISVDWDKAFAVAQQESGIPVKISS